MPYKSEEDKKRWEREHRAQRNARRRIQRVTEEKQQTIARRTPDQPQANETDSVWRLIVKCAVYLAFALLSVCVDAKIPAQTEAKSSQGPNHSAN